MPNRAALNRLALNGPATTLAWEGFVRLALTGSAELARQDYLEAAAGLTLTGSAALTVGAGLAAAAGLTLTGSAALLISLAATARLTLLGGGDLPAAPRAFRRLADPLDLRDTSVWPGYAALTIIPRVYGRTRVAGLRYAAHGKTYVLADHALAGVDAVYDDGVAIAGWRHDNAADLTGHAVAFVRLAEPPTGRLSADVRGRSGNPADILHDLYPRSDLQDLATACANAGLELGGALQDRQTVRAAVQFVATQLGGVWSAGMPGFATFFPPDPEAPIWATFGPLEVTDAAAQCQLSDIATRLTVPYDWDYAAGQARQSLLLVADTAATHGDRPQELALPWVKTARDALAIATRWLTWRARPLWTLTWTTGMQYRELQPGCWITIDAGLPVVGLAVVTDVDPGYGRGAVRIAAQAPAGSPPVITLRQAGVAF